MKLYNSTEWLFFHLWKKNPDTQESCPQIRIPETVFYRWAQPYFWYNTDKKDILNRLPRDRIQMDVVKQSFLSKTLPSGITALYINPQERKVKEEEYIQFEYMTKEDTDHVFYQREKTLNCIIQQIVPPINDQNHLIQVKWCNRFTIVTRRVNINNINKKDNDIVSKMATFDGSFHLSITDPICSPFLEDLIDTTCANIASHIQTVSGGNIRISRMTLYFRIDTDRK